MDMKFLHATTGRCIWPFPGHKVDNKQCSLRLTHRPIPLLHTMPPYGDMLMGNLFDWPDSTLYMQR